MTLLEGLILGFVQGFTEFLPVSSSGHLVIGQTVLGISTSGVLFEVAVHVATLASVLVVYRNRVGRLVTGALRGDPAAWRYVGLLVVATIPAAVIGLLFGSRVEALFESPVTVGVALLVTGCVLWSTRWASPSANPPASDTEVWSGAPSVGAALVMGVAQAFALVPGISRSGSTVVAALWAGVEVREAAAFSFLMAIPAITGAAILQIPEVTGGRLGPGTGALVAGGLMAGVTGIAAIRIFIAMLKGGSFHRFGIYCWLAGGAFLLFLGLR